MQVTWKTTAQCDACGKCVELTLPEDRIYPPLTPEGWQVRASMDYPKIRVIDINGMDWEDFCESCLNLSTADLRNAVIMSHANR